MKWKLMNAVSYLKEKKRRVRLSTKQHTVMKSSLIVNTTYTVCKTRDWHVFSSTLNSCGDLRRGYNMADNVLMHLLVRAYRSPIKWALVI